jgi:hypothetical protein
VLSATWIQLQSAVLDCIKSLTGQVCTPEHKPSLYSGAQAHYRRRGLLLWVSPLPALPSQGGCRCVPRNVAAVLVFGLLVSL